jgi:hypothetical protein
MANGTAIDELTDDDLLQMDKSYGPACNCIRQKRERGPQFPRRHIPKTLPHHRHSRHLTGAPAGQGRSNRILIDFGYFLPKSIDL